MSCAANASAVAPGCFAGAGALKTETGDEERAPPAVIARTAPEGVEVGVDRAGAREATEAAAPVSAAGAAAADDWGVPPACGVGSVTSVWGASDGRSALVDADSGAAVFLTWPIAPASVAWPCGAAEGRRLPDPATVGRPAAPSAEMGLPAGDCISSRAAATSARGVPGVVSSCAARAARLTSRPSVAGSSVACFGAGSGAGPFACAEKTAAKSSPAASSRRVEAPSSRVVWVVIGSIICRRSQVPPPAWRGS